MVNPHRRLSELVDPVVLQKEEVKRLGEVKGELRGFLRAAPVEMTVGEVLR